jgi:uncharacterized repeat protein (TIGR03803 family)
MPLRQFSGAQSVVLPWAFAFLLVFFAAQLAQGSTLTTLYSFRGVTDGASPYAGLIMDATGNLYGTTFSGGDLSCNNGYGCGTVFELVSTGSGWTQTVLYSFTGLLSRDGRNPTAGLVIDATGNLYGTTYYGGTSHGPCRPSGCGVIFKLDATGKESIVYTFTGAPDGANPQDNGSLVMDAAGNLYGTTKAGGTSGKGTVFKLDASGKETVLHSFAGKDGANPYAGLIMDAAGNLYGTTFNGGNLSCNKGKGCGVVFKLKPAGGVWNETVLYRFVGLAFEDGRNPTGGLILDGEGNLYGTTYYGGTAHGCNPSGCGTVFKLDTTGAEKVLYGFTGAGNQNPEAGLVQDSVGNLFGTASGGVGGGGTVFELTPSGQETGYGSGSGKTPLGSLVRDAEGNLFGTTQAGGTDGWGTVFELSP